MRVRVDMSKYCQSVWQTAINTSRLREFGMLYCCRFNSGGYKMVRVLGRANSINVQKVMWLGAEIGLDIDRVDIGGPLGGNDTPEYLAKNPTGKIPTLEDGDLILWESHTIVRYLAEVYGSSPWWPEKIEDRYHANQWMDFYRDITSAYDLDVLHVDPYST